MGIIILVASGVNGLNLGSLIDAGLSSYDGALAVSPIATKCCTSAGGFFLGDVIAQTVQKRKDSPAAFDVKRSAIMTSFGILVHAPFCHYLFNFLEGSFPGKDPLVIATKIGIDQVRESYVS
jgi:hypothetical protein